jgi:hypothetical protein
LHQFAPLDLIAAHPWKRALFTTFALSASFAEAVVLDALLRRGVTDIRILCDPTGLLMALQEGGAVRVGREYALEPVAVDKGCFHPKLLVLADDERAHIVVGSGNLTFGGWCANLECIDHVHADGGAQAMMDVADFFETLASEPRANHGASDACIDMAARLRRAAGAGRDDGTRRILHSLGTPIAAQLAAAARDLGGAERIACASPYWDGGKAMDHLARDLGLGEYFAHVPERTVRGREGMDWPRTSTMARPALITALTGESSLTADGAVRPLHAKLIEIVCREGRLILSGSANATAAALSSGQGIASGNIEVSSLRIQRGAAVPWEVHAARAPGVVPSASDERPDDLCRAVLRAELRGFEVAGQVVSRWSPGDAEATLEIGHQSLALGPARVDERGCFSIRADVMDAEKSLSGRMQLRLRAGSDEAEGFVTYPDFETLSRRTGGRLPSLLNAMKNLHTPEDVLAIIEFIQQNPGALRTPDPFGRRSRSGETDRPDPTVSAEYLRRLSSVVALEPTPEDPGQEKRDRLEASLQALMAKLMASMAKSRSRSEDEEDAADPTEAKRRKRTEKDKQRADVRFGQYFQHLTAQIDDDATYVNAVWLTQFVCVATDHRATRVFLERLIQIGLERALGWSAGQVAAWCILAAAAADGGLAAASLARARLAMLSLDPNSAPDADYRLDGYLDLLAPGASPDVVLERIRAVRTVHDEIRSLEAALKAGAPPGPMPSLEACEDWPKLARELAREPARRRIHFEDHPVKACPTCHIALRNDLRTRLARRGLCALDCHGILLSRNVK